MSPRYAVRRVTTDSGEVVYWLIEAESGKKLMSNVDRSVVAQLADKVNAKIAARAVARDEAGCW